MNGLEGFGAQTADASQRKPLPAAKPASKGGESQEPAAAQSAPDAPREGSAQPTSETPAAPAQDGQKKTSSFSDVIGEVEVQVDAEGGDPVQTTQLPTPTLPQLPLNPEAAEADPTTPEIAAATVKPVAPAPEIAPDVETVPTGRDIAPPKDLRTAAVDGPVAPAPQPAAVPNDPRPVEAPARTRVSLDVEPAAPATVAPKPAPQPATVAQSVVSLEPTGSPLGDLEAPLEPSLPGEERLGPRAAETLVRSAADTVNSGTANQVVKATFEQALNLSSRAEAQIAEAVMTETGSLQGSDRNARTAAPTVVLSPTSPPPAQAAQISNQLVAAIARTGNDRVEVRLDPPELGRVSLSITITEQAVTALVSAERTDVTDLMRRHADQMQRELESAGFENIDLQFDSSSSENAEERDDVQQQGALFDAGQAKGDAAATAYVNLATDRMDIRV